MNTQIQAKWFAYHDTAGQLHPTWCSKCAPMYQDDVVPIINIDEALWTCSVCHKTLIEIVDEVVKESSTWQGFVSRLANMGFKVIDCETDVENLLTKYGI